MSRGREGDRHHGDDKGDADPEAKGPGRPATRGGEGREGAERGRGRYPLSHNGTLRTCPCQLQCPDSIADQFCMKWRSRRWLYPDDGDMRFRTYLRAAYQRPGGRLASGAVLRCAQACAWALRRCCRGFSASWQQSGTRRPCVEHTESTSNALVPHNAGSVGMQVSALRSLPTTLRAWVRMHPSRSIEAKRTSSTLSHHFMWSSTASPWGDSSPRSPRRSM